jgi:hypothetical protein
LRCVCDKRVRHFEPSSEISHAACCFSLVRPSPAKGARSCSLRNTSTEAAIGGPSQAGPVSSWRLWSFPKQAMACQFCARKQRLRIGSGTKMPSGLGHTRLRFGRENVLTLCWWGKGGRDRCGGRVASVCVRVQMAFSSPNQSSNVVFARKTGTPSPDPASAAISASLAPPTECEYIFTSEAQVSPVHRLLPCCGRCP